MTRRDEVERYLVEALDCVRSGLPPLGNAANQALKALDAMGVHVAVMPPDDTHPCSDCEQPYFERLGSYWLTDDALWYAVVSRDDVALCPACFVDRARRLGVHLHWVAVEDAP